MGNLYKDLAPVYEAMYQTFIDYKEEYLFYKKIIDQYSKNSILEIGSGTGHLANYFTKNGYQYSGLDYSPEMIAIAQNKNIGCSFYEGDMRTFRLDNPVQSVLIPARTISFLMSNDDVNKAFASFYSNLKKGGILVFDFIDASQFIPQIAKGVHIKHEAAYNEIEYFRESFWQPDLTSGMSFSWASSYYQKTKDQPIFMGKDDSVVRSFTLDELKVFLQINNFKVMEVLEKTSYAFPTLVIVAQKI